VASGSVSPIAHNPTKSPIGYISAMCAIGDRTRRLHTTGAQGVSMGQPEDVLAHGFHSVQSDQQALSGRRLVARVLGEINARAAPVAIFRGPGRGHIRCLSPPRRTR
jgi:hypothetical protein